jgi:endonuclease/exonuclease/phosphatase family metal-dependent hydrolase
MRTLTLLVILGLLFGCARESDIRKTPLLAKAGQVSLLTLNVAGLPDFLSSQDYPRERMYGISHYANAYDVVAYQEDFYYSAALDRHSRFPYIERATKWHKWSIWPWLRKSGITIQTPWAQIDPKFHAYTTCDGYSNHGSDCWVPKGVLCTRTVLPIKVVMDVCSTHMDAGGTKTGWEVKGEQVEEYLAFLPEPVTDEPYILVELGDYNMRPGHPFMQRLTAGKEIVISERYGQADFVEYNEVDYIMVTSNELVNVTTLDAGTAPEFNGWSDHYGVFALIGLDIVQ